MQFKSLRPMLWTSALDETIRFYTDVLGFTCGARNEEWGWAALHREDVEIMLARPNEHVPFERPQFTGSFYFVVDDVEKLWEELRIKANVCYELETFEWNMREFAIYDNNGYLLQFGQEIDTAAA
jgi:catechol 2,3-dioxygenase-like lactoylglutathione lyase family enzyme